MPWEKANPKLIEMLEKVVIDFPCDRRFMFGSPTFSVNNNMFAGVHQNTVILRLSDTDRAGLFSKHPEAGPFTPMPGRPMKEYAALPENLVKNAAVFRGLVERSYQYAVSIPAKPAKRKTNVRQNNRD
jgi:TfoX/Sxy family transcriptional regulator of competence genes